MSLGRRRAEAREDALDALREMRSEDLHVVLAMCLYNREIEEGRAPAPYGGGVALRWAGLVLGRDVVE